MKRVRQIYNAFMRSDRQAGLVLAIDVAQPLSVTVLDVEAGGRLFDEPRRRETALRHLKMRL